MSSALSGLRNHQTMLDVVGNDIANVSTVGFKSSTTIFSDVLTQTLQGAAAPANGAGGTNPAQIGLGSRLVGTVQSFAQGAIQRTGRPTDLAVQGDGFFVVQGNGQQLYTRAGSFTLDAAGNLTTQEGMLVQGWQADNTGAIDANQAIGGVQIRVGELQPPNQTELAELGGNLSADSVLGDSFTITVTGNDSQGAVVPINLTYTKTGPDPLAVPPVVGDEWTTTATYTVGGTTSAVALTDNVLTFDINGELTAPADHNMNIAGGLIPGMPNAITFELGAAGTPGRLTQYAGEATVGVKTQDGAAAGTLQSFNVSQSGMIVGSYSNGRSKAIGQVALAVFTNPEGLERIAGAWRETANSGLAQVGTAGGGGRGLLSSGTLEMSNVDLAEEFTRLIIAQRGFQGNARVITTADEILGEVVNLVR
ncbi:MAG TPA: flagellar hook protein FlgE [Ilumatobacteraceae bacterium]|nr:flagellar hook protein FlgE [Ilumatobacteraceae bacterium]